MKNYHSYTLYLLFYKKILQHFERVSIVHPKLTKTICRPQTVSCRLKVNEITAN